MLSLRPSPPATPSLVPASVLPMLLLACRLAVLQQAASQDTLLCAIRRPAAGSAPKASALRQRAMRARHCWRPRPGTLSQPAPAARKEGVALRQLAMRARRCRRPGQPSGPAGCSAPSGCRTSPAARAPPPAPPAAQTPEQLHVTSSATLSSVCFFRWPIGCA